MSFNEQNQSFKKIETEAEHEEGICFKAPRVPLPQELTAEWTVKARLKFAKAGETLKKEFNSDDTVQPVHITYKWCNIDVNDKSYDFNLENDKARESCSRSSVHLHDPTKNESRSNLLKEESIHSSISSVCCENIAGTDSAFCSSNNSSKRQHRTPTNFYGTRCQSTCNITVTAIADFLPPLEDKILPQNILDSESNIFKISTESQNKEARTIDSTIEKITNLRDAVCQTSDTETKYSSDLNRSPLERRDSRRLYDYRKFKTDESIKQMEYRGRTEGGNNFKPSYTLSTEQTKQLGTEQQMTSTVKKNMGSSGKRSKSSTESQKKPRTVHIDVYCTGSEDDGQADGESSSDDNNKKGDQESNSTFQTVLENDQIRLSHHRITGASLPRRLAEQENMLENLKNFNIGHALTKSRTAEEVNESKQLLFRKHIGDQRAAKLQNIRQKYLRQLSDDTLSLEYPNSSRSTIRDNTCSSISSAFVESSWKGSDNTEEPLYSLAKSDSFEYENTSDRLRIKQMEHLWSRNYSNDEEIKFQNYLNTQTGNNNLQTISELTSLKSNLSCSPKIPKDSLPEILETQCKINKNLSDINEDSYESAQPTSYKLQQVSHFSRNSPGFLQFFGPPSEVQSSAQIKKENIPLQQSHALPISHEKPLSVHPNYKNFLQRWKSETRDNLSSSETPVLTPTEISRQQSPQPYLGRSASEEPLILTATNTLTTYTPAFTKRFNMHRQRSPVKIDTSSQAPPFGYSSEYLDKAKMFGKLVTARKPGHHVGPTKNPNCSCECCQRWLSERFQSRNRLFSLGEMPILKRPS